jgi:hypothetical protein
MFNYCFSKIVLSMRECRKILYSRRATDDKITRRMRFACWKTKATNTQSKYVILIAFPRQQWLRERASMLCYTYIACFVKKKLI